MLLGDAGERAEVELLIYRLSPFLVGRGWMARLQTVHVRVGYRVHSSTGTVKKWPSGLGFHLLSTTFPIFLF